MTAGQFREVGVDEAVALAKDGYRVIDVREQDEWDAGHVPGATLLPVGEVPSRIAEVVPDRDTPLLLHCRSGGRSARAAAWLASLGYSDVVNLNGMIDQWQAAGGAWEEPRSRDAARAVADRHARQVLVPEVGREGQRRLRDARVLVVGAGGLGSPVALYLTAAGIGTIGLADADLVEESNLGRQVIHDASSIGLPKVDSAERALRALDPSTEVVTHAERIVADNAERIVGGYDIVVDATDGLEARYVLNDAAVALRRPLVHGSVHRWEGHVTTIVPFAGPCYRCIHPASPPAELAPDCDVAGVVGVVPGIVGMLQATEVVKLILGAGETLAGRLLVIDALTASFDEVRMPPDPECPACGARARARVPAASAPFGG